MQSQLQIKAFLLALGSLAYWHAPIDLGLPDPKVALYKGLKLNKFQLERSAYARVENA